MSLALSMFADPQALATIAVASLIGMTIGSIPGLTAVMGTALLVPITFFTDPIPAVAAIVALTATAIFAGDMPGALLRIPGTPASAAYGEEAYALTRESRPEIGLTTSLSASVAGGLIETAFLIFAAPLLARLALGFSTPEYFWPALLGLSCAAFVSSGDPLKDFASLLLGLAVATVGTGSASGIPRFTLGSTDLLGGINLIPALIGMFAVSEILRDAASRHGAPPAQAIPAFGRVTAGLLRRPARHWRNVARGGVLGTLIGALPGAGADFAAWISDAVSKRFARKPEMFGKGSIRG